MKFLLPLRYSVMVYKKLKCRNCNYIMSLKNKPQVNINK